MASKRAATPPFEGGKLGVLQCARTYLLTDDDDQIQLNLSGRGDKDVAQAAALLLD